MFLMLIGLEKISVSKITTLRRCICNDSRLSFIQPVVDWLNCWNILPGKIGKLTPQTLRALDIPVWHFLY